MSTSLRVVAASAPIEVSASEVASSSLSERILQLQMEARRLAREHVDFLGSSLLQTRRLADEIARRGEAYPPGVRDIARRLCEESANKALALEAIMARL